MHNKLLFFCIASALVCLGGTQKNLRGEFRKAHEFCQLRPETRIEDDLMDRAAAGQTVDEYKLGNHLFCMYIKMGIMSRDGSINAATLKQQLVEPVKDETVINRIVRNCAPSRIHHGTQQEIAAELFRCVRRNLENA